MSTERLGDPISMIFDRFWSNFGRFLTDFASNLQRFWTEVHIEIWHLLRNTGLRQTKSEG